MKPSVRCDAGAGRKWIPHDFGPRRWPRSANRCVEPRLSRKGVDKIRHSGKLTGNLDNPTRSSKSPVTLVPSSSEERPRHRRESSHPLFRFVVTAFPVMAWILARRRSPRTSPRRRRCRALEPNAEIPRFSGSPPPILVTDGIHNLPRLPGCRGCLPTLRIRRRF